MTILLPEYQNLSLSDVRSRITRLAYIGKPEQQFLYSNITDWEQGKKRKLMLDAQRYYRNDNDIVGRKRYYIDRKGNRQELKNLSNSKLAHPFMRKLTNQKVNYLLSRDFSVVCGNETFADELNNYFDKSFRRMLKTVGRDAVVNGIAWLQVYYDKKGQLKFKRIPPEEIIPFWADAEHTELDGILRVYKITKFLKSGYKQHIQKVEYHTLSGVWYYEMGDKGLIPDPDMSEGPQGHFAVGQEVDSDGNITAQPFQAVWERVPFVAFKYNADEISLLKWVRPLIDDYDKNTSDTSNNLQDVPNNIKVVRNYDGTDKGEFVENLATFRTAFVSNDGDMTTLNTPLDTTAIDSHLNRLKKDIYDAGNGIDTQDDNLGNASGVALRFRYAGLEMDASDMGNEFRASLECLIWFIAVDLAAKGLGDFVEEDVDIIFNTDIIVNESEVILDAKNSAGIISDETIIANHPWVRSVEEEQENLRKQREEALAEMQSAIMTESSFGQTSVNTNEQTDTEDMKSAGE